MAISDLFRKKAVENSMEIEPGIVLNVYGASQSEATKLLETYAGKQQAHAWQKEPEYHFSSREYQGDKRGLSFHYQGKTLDGPVPMPSVTGVRSFSVPVGDTQIIDGAGPVRASQSGKVINININLAELPGFNGRPTEADVARMREEFKHTLREVTQRVSVLESQLKMREQEIERLQTRKVESPAPNLATKTEEKVTPGANRNHEICFESPNALVSDRLANELKKVAASYLKSGAKEDREFGGELSQAARQIKNAAKEQEKERTFRIECTFPDSKATVLVQEAMKQIEEDIKKPRFGREIASEADLKKLSDVVAREVAGLQNIHQEQTAHERDMPREVNKDLRPVLQELTPRGTLIETVKSAQEAFGRDIVFVNSNWQSHKGEIIQSSERILRAANATEKAMRDAGLSPAYCITENGTVRNLNTKKDEFFICDKNASKDEALPERLRVALQKHYGEVDISRSMPSKMPDVQPPSIGVGV